uniref:Uncharacterized protein n=1 Tax=Nelumbo nucifera TaxID=4432 RepID=A0A822XS06_NELNU|nr:TPA_asm: hypothetical protein HUJ06_023916 [Nelumbo nucifera]
MEALLEGVNPRAPVNETNMVYNPWSPYLTTAVHSFPLLLAAMKSIIGDCY